jgi:DNA anti-recombination protein RmuC
MMTTDQRDASNPLQGLKAATAGLELQQEQFQQWSKLWPGVPGPQTAWVEQMRTFQKEWSKVVTELARKHQDVLDRQYKKAVESLEEALSVVEATDVDEFHKRAEQLCRKTVDCLHEVAEIQLRELQEAFSKWSGLMTKAAK